MLTKTRNTMATVAIVLLAASLTACGTTGKQPTDAPTSTPSDLSTRPVSKMGAWDTNGDGILVVGLAQTGSESSWRIANSQSFQDYFVEAHGFKLLFGDGNGDEALQKAQVSEFIAQGAEVIIIQPVTTDGWTQLLLEARDKGIPVINFAG